MLDYKELASRGLDYHSFLKKYGSPEQQRRWNSFLETVKLTQTQVDLLKSFKREMHVFVSAGAWCGDCINQCPIFARFAEFSPNIRLLFFDRDDCPDFTASMQVCGGQRVPAVLFLSEDFAPSGRYGDRTLEKYRAMTGFLAGSSCPTGLGKDPSELHNAIIAEWLEQFERNQLILRTSPRLRNKHGD